MTRALVVAPQWIGDAVMSQPLVAALQAEGAQVTVAALPAVAPACAAMPGVADVVTLPFAHGRLDLAARWRLGRGWRGGFDVAYVLPNTIKAALSPFFAGIPRRVGYRGEGRPWLLTEARPNPEGRPPMVDHYRALAAGPFAADLRPVLSVSSAAREAALSAAGLVDRGYWAFAPGAEYGPAKRWPVAHYAALAAALHARDGAPVVLLGSPAERALCDEVAAAAPGACRVLAGTTPLAAAIALVAAARGVVSNDSGLMHVAAAFGVPQVAVFGSTSPLHTPPRSPRARVLWLKDELDLPCMPCFERTCRYGHHACLTSVAPARVEAALDAALAA